MPVKKRLDEAFEEIIDSIVETLQGATEEGELLEEIKSVVRGDRSRPRPDLPALWIFPERATAQSTPRTIAETWDLPISLTVVVKSDDPEIGQKVSTRLSALSRSVILKDRSLGLRDFVQDTRSGSFEPSGPHHNEGTLWGSASQIIVKFVICE